MTTLDELAEALDAPGRKDFRRVGKGVPMVHVNGKWERYSRSSNAGKVLDDENGLTDWKLRTMLLGAAYRPELMAQVSTLDTELDKKELRDIAEECLVAGKGRSRQVKGTAVHAMLDHIDLRHEWEPSPDYALACAAYVQALAVYGLVVLDVEVPCINVGERLAGTMDRRYSTTRVLTAPDGTTIPIGTVLASDTKTGRTLEYSQGTYSTQLAAYVDSERYDVEANTHEPFEPGTYKEWALIMHVVVEDALCNVYWVDLAAGREGLKLAKAVKLWRKRDDLIVPCVAPSWPVAVPAPVPQPLPASMVPEEPERPPREPESALELEAVYEWLRERVAGITAVPEAKAMLLREWPADVPGLKVWVHSPEQLAAIERVVDEVEKEHSLPFPKMRPGTDPKDGVLDGWLLLAGCHRHSPVGEALALFASLEDYTTLELSELLDAAMRGIGYEGGMQGLDHIHVDDAQWLIHAASLVRQETHVLRYIDGKPLMLKRIFPINPS